MEELDALLDQLTTEAAKRPFMVELFGRRGAALSIGLGRAISIANFTSSNGRAPYFQSDGEHTTEEEEDPLVFFYGGDWSEFPASSGIPVPDAREALRRFFRSGALPDNLHWREV
jgi:hypothetical protein